MVSEPIGYFTFVLHSHIPYVLGHGRWPHGTDWLNEAAAESYIPILNILNKLVEEGISPHLTLSLSPVLVEQLADVRFKDEFIFYLKNKIEYAIDDRKYFLSIGKNHLADLAKYWENFYNGILNDFQTKYDGDLIHAFRKLQEEGHIELITCAATHAYLPLLSQDTSIQAQIKIAIEVHTHHFKTRPNGIWLPECGYRPSYLWTPPITDSEAGKRPILRKGIEEFLAENRLSFFFIDSHLLSGGKAIGVYLQRFEALRKLWGIFTEQYKPLDEIEDEPKSPYQVYLVSSHPQSRHFQAHPVAIYTRDPKTALQVWSGEHGYPGDSYYLEFHKKHFPGGHRYWRVTKAKSDLAEKQEYLPEKAQERVKEHASHFVSLVEETLKTAYQKNKKPNILCAPFDTELFGHWWFEGPNWLYYVLKNIAQNSEKSGIALTTASRYLEIANPVKVISIPEGSWGEGGFHYIWLNEWTSWIWKHIYDAEVIMQDLIEVYGKRKDPLLINVLKLAAVELLLLQSSDWPFLISTWSAKDYAETRVCEHYQNFMQLRNLAEKIGETGKIDEQDLNFIKDCQERCPLFRDITIDLTWLNELEYSSSVYHGDR